MAIYQEEAWVAYLQLSESEASLPLSECWLDIPVSSPHRHAEDDPEAQARTSPVDSTQSSIEPPPKPPPMRRGPEPPPVYPKRQSWPVVLGSFCALFASFGWRSGSGLFQDYYQHNQLRDQLPSTIAWINSIGFFLVYFGAIFVNLLNNRFGPRTVLVAASALHVGGLLATSFCSTFWQIFLAQGVCSSLGASALFFTSVTTLGRWFRRNQALTIGISASGTSVGGVVFPLMIEHLLPRIGFAWTFRAVVLLVLLLVSVASGTIRPPPPSPPKPVPPPLPTKAEDQGLQSPAPLTNNKREGQDTQQEKKTKKSKPSWIQRWKPRFQDPIFLLTVLGIALFSSGYFVTLTFVVTVARYRGWRDVIDAIVVLNAASFFGRILPGLVADRVGRFNTMIVLSTLSTLLIFGLWIPGNSVPAAIAFSATFGFTSGCTVSLGPSMMFQISDLRVVTSNIAALYVVQSFAALITSPIGGALVQADTGQPLYLQAYCGGITALGTLLFVAARVRQSGWVLVKNV